MNTISHPYGTTLRGKLEAIYPNGIHCVMDEKHEGHLLAAGAEDKTAKVGDEGTLTFTQGGPTGGYWKFTKDPSQKMSHAGVVRLRRQRKFYR